MNLNKVLIAGRLTKDPEVRNTQGGLSVCNFAIANNRKISDKEIVVFVDVTAFGKPAEAIAQYLRKGDRILVDGRLEQETWEKDGQKRSKMKIVVDRFEFVDSPKDREQTQAPAKASTKKQADNDDIPF